MIELVIHTRTSVILLAHNHPSGLTVPSSGDKDVTESIRSLMENIGVYLLDHLIFADKRYSSIMRDHFGNFRCSPITQEYDPMFFEHFYTVKGEEYRLDPPIPGGTD